MKVAAVIAVSNYSLPFSNLLACQADAELIRNILTTTKQYDDILCIHEETQSASLKSQLSTWFENIKDKGVTVIFFYYSRHGDFHSNELYFPLSDFSPSRRNR